MAKFEKVSRFADADIQMPKRKTTESAGYDMVVAEDVVIPSYSFLKKKLKTLKNGTMDTGPKFLSEMANMTKTLGAKPTLVSTGMKCKLDPSTYLELSVRSSCPLKYWLIMGNSVGRQRF